MSGVESTHSIHQYTPPEDDGARFAADAAAMVGDIQDSAEINARVSALVEEFRSHATRIEELTSLAQELGDARKDATASSLPSLRTIAAELETLYVRIDRVQALLSAYETALVRLEARAEEVEAIAPPTTISRKIGSFFSSLIAPPPPPRPAGTISPWPGAAGVVPSAADCFGPATGGASETEGST